MRDGTVQMLGIGLVISRKICDSRQHSAIYKVGPFRKVLFRSFRHMRSLSVSCITRCLFCFSGAQVVSMHDPVIIFQY